MLSSPCRVLPIAPRPWMTLLSGATPEIHGFTTNDTIGKVAPDTVLRRALAARRNTVVIGGQIWEDVLNNDIQRFDLAPAPVNGDIDAEAARAAVEVINDRLTAAQLVILELEGMTNRADARSVERVDAALRVIAEAVSFLQVRARPRRLWWWPITGCCRMALTAAKKTPSPASPWSWPASASARGRV